ncbi:MAG: hypothetical protein GF364_11880 [Candidatus Lokiarchaeota archaeon]|nr:hypothetical protein [Candidatus Lokiarchaeota archaeon]
MKSEDIQIMRKFLSRKLKIRTDIAYPDILDEKFNNKLEDAEIFNALIPNIFDNIIEIIYSETFGQVSGSNLMQATKFKTLMAKKYEHLRKIIGDTRYERYINFPQKVRKWRDKKLSTKKIRLYLVESLMSLYLTAAKRDETVYQVELLPIAREKIKTFINDNYEELKEISAIKLDKIVRNVLRMLDIGRAKTETKNLVKDIQTYCTIIYFINKFEQYDIVTEKKDIVPILDVIRNEFIQICEKLIQIEDVQHKIDFIIKKDSD